MDTMPTSSEGARLIKSTLAEINHIIPDMLQTAYERSHVAMQALDTPPEQYKTHYASTMLVASRRYFETHTPSEWVLHPSTNRFHIIHRETGLTVRFLHGFLGKNLVPPAGSNNARRHDWYQSSLFVNSMTYSLADTSLVVVWTETGGDFTTIAYHPITAGKFPNSAGVDLSIPLGIPDPEYLEFEDLQFNPEEETITLLPFDQTIEEIAPQVIQS